MAVRIFLALFKFGAKHAKLRNNLRFMHPILTQLANVAAEAATIERKLYALSLLRPDLNLKQLLEDVHDHQASTTLSHAQVLSRCIDLTSHGESLPWEVGEKP